MCIRHYVGFGDLADIDGCGHRDPNGTPMGTEVCPAVTSADDDEDFFAPEPASHRCPHLTWRLHGNGTKYCEPCREKYRAVELSWTEEKEGWRRRDLAGLAPLFPRIWDLIKSQCVGNRQYAVVMYGPNNRGLDEVDGIVEMNMEFARGIVAAIDILDAEWDDKIKALGKTVKRSSLERRSERRKKKRREMKPNGLEEFRDKQKEWIEQLDAKAGAQ